MREVFSPAVVILLTGPVPKQPDEKSSGQKWILFLMDENQVIRDAIQDKKAF